MVVTLGQQYNVGEKSPDIILYTYINRHVGTPEKQQKQKQCIVCSTSIIKHGRSSILLHSRLYTVKTKPLFLFSFSFVSLIADGPHHYHPACPVVTKDLPISPRFTPYIFFIAMQLQHSYNSSTNG